MNHIKMNILDPDIVTPFFFEGQWRSNLSEVTLSFEAIDAMMKHNPSILLNPIDTSNPIIKDYVDRSEVKHYIDVKIDEIWKNLINYFARAGYTHHASGEMIDESNIHDNGRFTFISAEGTTAIVDINLSGKVTSKMLDKVDADHHYLIMDSKNLPKEEGITILSPLILSISPSQHILSPKTRKVYEREIIELADKYPTISETDPLMREMGYVKGDVIEVLDFSRHYRRVI